MPVRLPRSARSLKSLELARADAAESSDAPSLRRDVVPHRVDVDVRAGTVVTDGRAHVGNRDRIELGEGNRPIAVHIGVRERFETQRRLEGRKVLLEERSSRDGQVDARRRVGVHMDAARDGGALHDPATFVSGCQTEEPLEGLRRVPLRGNALHERRRGDHAHAHQIVVRGAAAERRRRANGPQLVRECRPIAGDDSLRDEHGFRARHRVVDKDVRLLAKGNDRGRVNPERNTANVHDEAIEAHRPAVREVRCRDAVFDREIALRRDLKVAGRAQRAPRARGEQGKENAKGDRGKGRGAEHREALEKRKKSKRRRDKSHLTPEQLAHEFRIRKIPKVRCPWNPAPNGFQHLGA